MPVESTPLGRTGIVEWNEFFRPTEVLTQNFGMKFRKMSVQFAPPPGISGIFGRMEGALYMFHCGLLVANYWSINNNNNL